jgi:hypothetical protein
LITLIYDESELNPVYMSEMARTFDGYLKETVTIRVECTLAGLRASADSNAVAVRLKKITGAKRQNMPFICFCPN